MKTILDEILAAQGLMVHTVKSGGHKTNCTCQNCCKHASPEHKTWRQRRAERYGGKPFGQGK